MDPLFQPKPQHPNTISPKATKKRLFHMSTFAPFLFFVCSYILASEYHSSVATAQSITQSTHNEPRYLQQTDEPLQPRRGTTTPVSTITTATATATTTIANHHQHHHPPPHNNIIYNHPGHPHPHDESNDDSNMVMLEIFVPASKLSQGGEGSSAYFSEDMRAVLKDAMAQQQQHFGNDADLLLTAAQEALKSVLDGNVRQNGIGSITHDGKHVVDVYNGRGSAGVGIGVSSGGSNQRISPYAGVEIGTSTDAEQTIKIAIKKRPPNYEELHGDNNNNNNNNDNHKQGKPTILRSSGGYEYTVEEDPTYHPHHQHHQQQRSDTRPPPKQPQNDRRNNIYHDDTDDSNHQSIDMDATDLEQPRPKQTSDPNPDQRAILQKIYEATGGERWGKSFQNWANPSVPECNLTGVNCKNSRITKIDLRGARLCDTTQKVCENSLPSEIGLLGSSLEVLDLSTSFNTTATSASRHNRQRLVIPTEIGLLTNLKILDLSHNHQLEGTIPVEIGLCTDLTVLNLSNNPYIHGPLPPTIIKLQKLEKLDLRTLNFSGCTIQTEIGRLRNLRELLFSNSQLIGTIPRQITDLRQLRNLELYANQLSGELPPELSRLHSLRRVDLSYNRFNGSIAELLTIPSLETVHLKRNRFEGTLPQNLGWSLIEQVSWFDISENRLRGEIPLGLGSLSSLKYFAAAQNMFQPPIPRGLCGRGIGGEKKGCNSANSYDCCDDIACPIGTYSPTGQSVPGFGCTACPDGTGNFYLGSVSCHVLSQRELLTMFYTIMNGNAWPPELAGGWKDAKVAECDWEGVTCNGAGKIAGLAFPASAVAFDEDLLSGEFARWK